MLQDKIGGKINYIKRSKIKNNNENNENQNKNKK
jgi:hypothetical protein